jgi:hypothetical protein
MSKLDNDNIEERVQHRALGDVHDEVLIIPTRSNS